MKSKKSAVVKAAPAIKRRRKVGVASARGPMPGNEKLQLAAEEFARMLRDSAEARRGMLLFGKVWREMSADMATASRRLLAAEILDGLSDLFLDGRAATAAS